ncbi:hypothetical protein [Verrucomicrobium spinosum]|uniref:hypothetical protein n=1 Tax=Verrucomicrobium spinosum TaxID=2736 RepID=UPI0001744604|nr:hypothetical protein [Verrucomicrobium spinosum]
MVNATFPADILVGLDLHEGDKVEGIVHDGVVTLHIAERAAGDFSSSVEPVKQFLAQWSGRFTLDDCDSDSRLDYLTQKHLR